ARGTALGLPPVPTWLTAGRPAGPGGREPRRDGLPASTGADGAQGERPPPALPPVPTWLTAGRRAGRDGLEPRRDGLRAASGADGAKGDRPPPEHRAGARRGHVPRRRRGSRAARRRGTALRPRRRRLAGTGVARARQPECGRRHRLGGPRNRARRPRRTAPRRWWFAWVAAGRRLARSHARERRGAAPPDQHHSSGTGVALPVS